MQTQVQQDQVTVVRIVNPGVSEERLRRNKKVIRSLGATETVMGLICSLLGVIVLGDVYAGNSNIRSSVYPYSTYGPRVNLGEGLWGGVLLIVGGGLGMACGKKTVTPCLVNCHMAFSIVGAVFSGIIFSISVPFTLVYSFTYPGNVYALGFASELAMAVLSFISLALCITSACLCCCASPVDMGSSSCCPCCPGTYQSSDGSLGYVMANQADVPVLQPYAAQTRSHVYLGTETAVIPSNTVQKPAQQLLLAANLPPPYNHPVDPASDDEACLLQDN